MRRQPTPPVIGTANLTVGRAVSPVTYELYENTGRGSATGTAEQMTEAFRTGEGVLARDGGTPLRVSFVGYTAGSQTAYFEPRDR